MKLSLVAILSHLILLNSGALSVEAQQQQQQQRNPGHPVSGKVAIPGE